MKLRWIDSKSKQMREVLIDLNAILTNRQAGTAGPGSRLSAVPSPLLATPEEDQVTDGLSSGQQATPRPNCWERPR